MANGRGYRRRTVSEVLSQRNGVAQAVADCGHYVIRLGHLGVGQVVYCRTCMEERA